MVSRQPPFDDIDLDDFREMGAALEPERVNLLEKKIDEIYGHRPEDGCESVIRTYEQIDEDIGEVTCSHG
jgi:hypothetical protein